MTLNSKLLCCVVLFILGFYVDQNAGEFSCFRKYRQRKRNYCGGLAKKKHIDTTEKCCSGPYQGFTVRSLNIYSRNKYECISCVEWEKQKNEPDNLVTPKPNIDLVCFKRWRSKTKQCGGPYKQRSFMTPTDCCQKGGKGYSEFGKDKLGKNIYTCKSCDGFIPTTTAPTPDFTPWGEWSPCDTTCGSGMQTRYRKCSNCNTKLLWQSRACAVSYYCPRDGDWGSWLSWQSCTLTCGGGLRRRTRQCDNPPPKHGGGDCKGEDGDEETCNEQPCQVPSYWSQWSRFGSCSHSCGRGQMTRSRDCVGDSCEGRTQQARNCEQRKCPRHGGWSTWNEWSVCPATCGTGMRTRSRECNRPRPLFGGGPCEGSDTDSEEYEADIKCPIHGGWSDWSSYGRCRGAPCQQGHRLRSRVCNNPRPQHRGIMCRGRAVERTSCFNEKGCPVDAGWCEFSDWSTCSATCLSQSSTQSRHRDCYCPRPENGGKSCTGDHVEVQECSGTADCNQPIVDLDTS